jgi:hypothetical protein
MSAAIESTGWHTPVPPGHPANALLSAKAVRGHCEEIFAAVSGGNSRHFFWHAAQLPVAAKYVAAVIRERYPDLKVPYHSRWRHFEAGGIDRWSEVFRAQGVEVRLDGNDAEKQADREERARARIDLVIPSVLLDAGAGAAWHYRDAISGEVLARSEGLGVASLALFASGVLSDRATRPLRTDAGALQRVRPGTIGKFFQVDDNNPLVGLDGRAALLSRLGVIASRTPAVFGTPGRLGNLYDYLKLQSRGGKLPASAILDTLLRALGPMWPGRIVLEGVGLGDCWPHPAAEAGLVPFHKLTQWLTYSMLEPLEEAGLTITGLDQLTGLPEYRNGGLLLDLGVITPRDATFVARKLSVGEEAVVEWRALTVVILDRLADAVRAELGVDAAEFPLARVLEGGTWAAGRKIAAERRPGGIPPVTIDSDGTVF